MLSTDCFQCGFYHFADSYQVAGRETRGGLLLCRPENIYLLNRQEAKDAKKEETKKRGILWRTRWVGRQERRKEEERHLVAHWE
ncbi:hypothetical protein [Microseira sp. BLCC-F43]|uniref:hypothetical protein n=1 Tax=Microseira sp. BLCC-F43 TaxID=3153602 RepID=UPI0035B9EE77